MQFKEHETGEKSTNPKIQKLDKLARLLNVQIKIDGIPYGAELETKDDTLFAEDIAEKYAINDDPKVEEPPKKQETTTTQEKPKSRGRPKKT